MKLFTMRGLLLWLLACSVKPLKSMNENICDKLCTCGGENSNIDFAVSCIEKNIEEVPKFPENATILKLDKNKIQKVQHGSFSASGNLKGLSLSENDLTILFPGAFTGLSELKWLNLKKNHLKYGSSAFPPGCFEGLPRLLKLEINNNNVENEVNSPYEYPDEALKDLTMLEYLTMDGLPEKRLGPGFSKLQRLTHLWLHGICNILKLYNDTFSNVPLLIHLDVSKCNIKYVDAGTFHVLPNIEYLDLSENVFLTFRSLRNISYGLQFSKLKTLKIQKIHTVFGLGTIIRKSDIQYIRNINITKLYLDSNRIELIEKGSLELCPQSIDFISVTDNRFTFGSYLFDLSRSLNHTTTINASNTGIMHFPLRGERIMVSNGRQSFHDDLGQIDYDNQSQGFIIPIPPSLTDFNFSNSGINYPVNQLNFTPNNLQNADFSKNLLHQWIGPIQNADNLRYLDLSDNYCTDLSKTFFTGLKNLHTLKIQLNLLGFTLNNDKDGQIFAPLTRLKHLFMSMNRIYELPFAIFSGLKSLETLDLSRNILHCLNINLEEMQNLSYIDLSENQLRSVPQRLRNHLSRIAERHNLTVDISKNPLGCTCEDIHLLQWLMNPNILFKNSEKNKCFKEDELISLADLKGFYMKLEKDCYSYAWVITLSSGFIAVALFVAISGIVYRYRWKLRYLYYMTRNKYKGYTAIDKAHAQGRELYRWDAFVSYSDENSRFVTDKLLPCLETDLGLSLCIHDRDFTPGEEIGANISCAIQNSYKTLVVLDRHFLESYWCRYELNMARMEALYKREGQEVLLLLLMEDMTQNPHLPLEILNLIHTHTYAEYHKSPENDAVIWEHLSEAIKH